ncbi:MAG: C45 family autoproteolytic acyltransferase/hydrolase [Phyllobacteriaceae bacterium]|nr:C45 family autoproteolytic acyltransferase/hydrolase [Phyllobacteriaceae bacterium]
MHAPFPLVRIEGSPRDRGLAYGRAAAERIAAGETLYREAMGRRGFDWSEVRRLAAEFRPSIEATDADCMIEIDAIAEGAGIDVETVIVINARSEIFNGRTPHAGALEGGCTSGLALSHATAEGRLLHAQNWDFNAACIGSSIVLHLTDEAGHGVLTFVEAGGLARSGLNSSGIAITANNLESDQDAGRTGMPLSMIRRRALMARTFAEAVGAITSAPRAVSNNMTLSHAGGDMAINLETTPDDVFVLYPEDNGLFAHANHFNAPEARVRLRDGALNGRTPCTLYRDKRVMHHLAADAPNVTRSTFERALADDFGHPFAVCRPPVRSRSGHLSTTVASVIFDAAAGALHVRPAPWDEQTRWATHRLDGAAARVAAQ